MFISSCPLRVSLFGGSTDNPVFVERYGYGSVISFACSLKTYITLHEDKLGYNNQGGKYVINYSKREEVNNVRKIKNELIRKISNKKRCRNKRFFRLRSTKCYSCKGFKIFL